MLLCCVTSLGSGWACGPSPDRRYFRNTFTLTKSADTTGQLMFTLLYDDGAVRVLGGWVAVCTLCLHFHSFPQADALLPLQVPFASNLSHCFHNPPASLCRLCT